ncbi:MAG: hypothetical protein EOO56_20175 [Hymenobacter sp.]|nr:MAG: hypothetical protein EOO56_20175 [Hymenobacter sp.]
MHLLPRLLGFGLLSLLVGLLFFTSCETSRRRESSDPTREAQSIADEATASSAAATTRQVAQVNEAGPPTFKTTESVLATAFIRQFGDGTVIDKILVRPAPSAPKEPTVYYLVGMGLHDGKFRAMALPLRNSGNGALLLSPTAERYVLTGSGCPTCYFKFEGSTITGSACDDNSDGAGSCTLQVLNGNTLLVRK